MCTTITYSGNDFYFGRNLDFEHSFSEKLIITSRNFPLPMRDTAPVSSHYAILGMGIVSDSFPLYFDAVNEKGVAMAGLLFPHFSHYNPPREDKTNVASFEFISYILSRCANVDEAKKLMGKINITDTHFSEEFMPTPLHWIVADKNGSIVCETQKEGLFVYDNPVGVLTNAPPFPSQMFNLGNSINLSPSFRENDFSQKVNLPRLSRGLGTVGLAGDMTSQSRFVRATFAKLNSLPSDTEQKCVNQVFHILDNVCQLRGSVVTENGEIEFTQYSSCINTEKCVYYYKTYDNSSLNAVCLFDKNLDADVLYTIDLIRDWRVNFQS